MYKVSNQKFLSFKRTVQEINAIYSSTILKANFIESRIQNLLKHYQHENKIKTPIISCFLLLISFNKSWKGEENMFSLLNISYNQINTIWWSILILYSMSEIRIIFILIIKKLAKIYKSKAFWFNSLFFQPRFILFPQTTNRKKRIS